MISSRYRFCLGVVLPLLSLASLLAAAAAANGQREEEGVDATVCQLVHAPNRFNGKTVRVKALVESDMIEHTMLVDESCKSYGVSLWIPHDLDDNSEVKELRKALKEQWKPGAAKTRVLGVFRGTFSIEGKKRFLKVAKAEKIEVGAR